MDDKINEIYELVKENNKLLKSEQRSRRLSRLLKMLWTLFIIAVPVLVYYYYIAPTIGSLQENLSVLQTLAEGSPQMKTQLEPIIEATRTIMNIFGISHQ